MYRSKLILVISILVFASSSFAAGRSRKPASTGDSAAQAPATTQAPQATQTASAKPRKNRALARVEIGVGYSIWNERFSITKSGTTSSGMASYGGYIVNLGQTWIRHRWQWGGDLGFGIGKASSNLGDQIFPEGRDRPWYVVQVAPYANYRVSMNGQFGLGVLARYRNVNWAALDPATQINVSQEFQFAPLLDIRWGFGKWSFIQTFAMLDSVGDSLWMWSLQRAF